MPLRDFSVSSVETITRYIIEKGWKSAEVKSLLNWVCTDAKTLSKDIAEVWVGYEKTQRNVPILVAELKRENKKLPPDYLGFQLRPRLPNHVSKEAESCIEKETLLTTKKRAMKDDEEMHKLQECLIAHSPSLFKKHRNLLIMSASRVKCKNYAECETKRPVYEELKCVVLYVKIKGIIPFDEEPFRETIDGFPVDVREAYFSLFVNDDNVDLSMGCKIENDYGMTGSLGGFVKLPNGAIGALTCWHLFATERSKADLSKDWPHHRNFKSDIYHSTSEKCKFGRVIQSNLIEGDERSVGIDAALLEITDPAKVPKSGHFPGTDSGKI